MISKAFKIYAECDPGVIPDPLDPDCTRGEVTLGSIISRFLPFIPVVVGLILLAMIVLGAIQIATSQGNEEKSAKGRKTIQNALIGAAIAILAVVIISIMEAILKVKILYGFGA